MAGFIPAIHVLVATRKSWMPGSSPGMTMWRQLRYLPSPPRLSKNTPCSPNMFQNHQGALSRNGRP